MAGADLSSFSSVYVAGHRGMAGSAIIRKMKLGGNESRLVTRKSSELDLRNQANVEQFFSDEKPELVIVAAAKVGGIVANDTYPADFIYDNLQIATNVIHSAWKAKVKRLLFLGSSCIYPKMASQPISEKELLTGPLEPTNEAYAIAKIAGLKLCEFYRKQYGCEFHSAMPCNLYGPGDNYHAENSHVIPGLIRRFHEAKIAGADSVTIWGSGTPKREFLNVNDLAEACLLLCGLNEPPNFVNIGAGEDVSIQGLSELIAGVVGFNGVILNDLDRPDGTPRKLMDSTLIQSLGWKPEIAIEEGLKDAYRDFLSKK